MIENKIQQQHTSKLAYVYLRQSTLAQVRFNQESTERQYALQEKAQAFGWPQTAIRVLDGDLGLSGSESSRREDFKTLVADVSMGKVGAVFALEASRLSRSCTDWHRLLELCALTGTLIIDEDGCYNPADFNDQLLLGLKGTMSAAELHFIRARLIGGKINKAKKGELRHPLPIGFCYDEEGRVTLDTDEQVREVIQLLFKIFKEKGSAYGVVYYFGQNNIQFPKRAYGGTWKGKLIWGRLSYGRVLGVLKNPCYAGIYSYGRYQHRKKLSETGELRITTYRASMREWKVMIEDHHEGYITREQYLTYQEMLKNNQTNKEENMLPTAAREGLALLQGMLICSKCGYRLTVRYKGNGGARPTYECVWKKKEGLTHKYCMSLSARAIDKKVTEKVLTAITPDQIEIALKAFKELEQRGQTLDKQWKMKIERANYEAQLAQRCYEEVDPANRLVAATLEKRWNNALSTLEETRAQYEEYQKKNILTMTQQQHDQLFALASDLPRLWNASTTNAKDCKRILRLFIKDITVEKLESNESEKKCILHLQWQSGATEDLEVELPKAAHEAWKHTPEIVERVRVLAVTLTDKQIANQLNQEGLKTNKGNRFTVNSIEWIRFKHRIPSVGIQKPGELSVNQAAEKFNVSHHVVRYWIERGMVEYRRIGSRLWVQINAEKEIELRKFVENSVKIAKVREKFINVNS